MKNKTNKIIAVSLCVFLFLTGLNLENIFTNSFKADTAEWNFSCTGSVQEFIAPKTGLYYIQTQGGSGGNNPNSANYGGSGYSDGEIILKEGEKLFITVGGKGTVVSSGTAAGGYNGGGSATGNIVISLVPSLEPLYLCGI